MLKALGSRLSYANVMATGAVFVALGGGAYALGGIPDGGGVFHGCVSNSTGVLRVVKSAGSCHKAARHGRHRNPGEFAVSWNQQGPRGLQGVQGAQGGQGTQGIQGPPGTQGPQGPGAISINMGNVAADGARHVLATINGVDAFYSCHGDQTPLEVGVRAHQVGDTVFASGDLAQNGTLTSVQASGQTPILSGSSSTANFDVIAWSGSVGKLARFDLGEFNGGAACNVWGVVIPGS
jgi:hypothetical protein